MPKYVYKCDNVEVVVERSVSEQEVKPTCPDCAKVMKRVFTAPPTLFAGNGWGRQAR